MRTPENRRMLNTSLARLGRCDATAHFTPDVFIENELAIAVRRFGTLTIFLRIIKQTYYGWRARQ